MPCVYFCLLYIKKVNLAIIIKIVIKKLQKGMSAEEIADFLEEDVLTIQRIYDIAKIYAPEYDIEKIVQKLGNTSGMKQK